MQLADSREIRAAPATVWAALFDPEVLRRCIPGCESMSGSAAQGYTAVVKQKVGPVSATFTGLITLSDIVEGSAVTLTGEGRGGAAGFAKGSARVTLAPSDIGTRLSYAVDAAVGGKLAQLGSRLIDGFMRKVADQFFANLQDAVEAPSEAEVADAGGAPKRGWFRRMIGA